MRKFSEQFIRRNLADTRAVRLAQAVDEKPKAHLNMSEKELRKLHDSIQGLINGNHLSSEYRSWKSPPPGTTNNVRETSHTTTINNNVVPGLPRVGVPLETNKFRIVIDSVKKRTRLGDGMFADEHATKGTVYIVVSYTVTNISRKPLSSWSSPKFYLRDEQDTKYDSDTGGTLAYAMESSQSEKSWSKLNPGVSTNGAEVFHVSEQLFDTNTWMVEVDADKDFRVALH